jgi:hypothetical protein
MLSNVDVRCPYCGEGIVLVADESAGSQHYTEDCQVCCRPMLVTVEIDDDGAAAVRVEREDG